MAAKASSCIFCGEGLSLFNRKTLYCCTTEQPTCKDCYAKLVQLPREEQGRRALATNRAEEPEKIRAYLAQREAAEEKKLQAAQWREAHLIGKLCLRCNAPMVKIGARRFQMYEYESLTDSIFNPASDTLLLDVMYCQQCRKVEFFLPDDIPLP